MSDVNSILTQRMKASSNGSKMASMARQSALGHLTSFSGIFSVSELGIREKEILSSILQNYGNKGQSIEDDLEKLITLTSEVKAINNQAALLHGERIKKAQWILKNYQEGAFTAWMIAAYGNRQTPYNLMQYFEFCEAMPKTLRPQIEEMPRQAIYVLATREGPLEKKQAIVESYQGETKREMLLLIQKNFPLRNDDKRKKNGRSLVVELSRLYLEAEEKVSDLTIGERKQITMLLKNFQELIKKSAD